MKRVYIQIRVLDENRDSFKRGNIYFFHRGMSFIHFWHNIWNVVKELKQLSK